MKPVAGLAIEAKQSMDIVLTKRGRGGGKNGSAFGD